MLTQKDRLSFSSLIHQIENGLNNDYTEDEIKEAVIKAINPALSLRSYLGAGVEQGLERFPISGTPSQTLHLKPSSPSLFLISKR